MNIPIDTEKKRTLLQWLKRGYIDNGTLLEWYDKSRESLTAEDINAELERGEECEYKLGLFSTRCRHRLEKHQCPMYNGEFDEWPNELKERLPKLTVSELATVINANGCNVEEVRSEVYKLRDLECHAMMNKDRPDHWMRQQI